jgi:hypothetical protein
MAKKEVKDDALGKQTRTSEEVAPGRLQEEARADIESAIIVARKFPRNESAAYQALLHACQRTNFAEQAMYSFPRFDSDENRNVDITGPSVKLAREAARVWGNMRWGFAVIADGEDTRTIEGWAYDLQTNTRPSQQDTFTKIGYTRAGGYKPLNERGLRETTSRRAAFLIRNSLLQLIPADFIDDAMVEVEKTLATEAKKDPDMEKKKIIAAFDSIGVKVADLEEYLKHSIDTASPAEIKKLRGMYKSIDDGNSTWAEYSGKGEAPAPKDTGAKKATAAPAASTNVTGEVQSTSQPANGNSKGKITDADKGLVWQIARKKLWAIKSGSPDDPLHQYLKKKHETPSVSDIRETDLKAILNALAEGPEKHGFQPVIA